METKIIPGLSHDDLVALVLEDMPPQRRFDADDKPLGITCQELADEGSLGIKAAETLLKKMVREKKFESRIELFNNRRVRVYYNKGDLK